MDKIFSTRIDDKIVRQIQALAQKTGSSKKAVIERAILLLDRKITEETGMHIMEQTSGIWSRNEPASKTASKIRKTFNASMERHKR